MFMYSAASCCDSRRHACRQKAAEWGTFDSVMSCLSVCAGVEVSPANLAAGLKFTWPTYKSGLRIMISAHLQTGSTWAFSEIFSWQVRSSAKHCSSSSVRALRRQCSVTSP